jgi:hypothetical protein
VTVLPVIAFFIYALPHHWSDSPNIGRGKCGLMTTSALSTVQILELAPACRADFMLTATRGARVERP